MFTKINTYFLPITIIVILIIGLVNSSLRLITSKSSFENRVIADCPIITKLKNERMREYISRMKNYPQVFENCFSDNFPFRSDIIAFTNYIKILAFDELPKKEFYRSKNNYFFHMGEDNISTSTGLKQFTNEELNNYKEVFTSRAKYLDEKNLKYFSLIIPNKNTVYSEYLQEDFRLKISPTKLDQIEEIIHPTGYKITNLKSELLDMKKSKEIFYQNDTHWNMEGVELAYKKFSYYVANNTNFALIPFQNFESFNTDHYGDVPRILGIKDLFVEKNVKGIRFNNSQVTNISQIFEPFELESGKKVASQLFLNKNKTLPKLVLLGDSYTAQLIPLLAENFSELYFIKSFEELPTKLIEEFKPDLILSLFNESYLNAKMVK